MSCNELSDDLLFKGPPSEASLSLYDGVGPDMVKPQRYSALNNDNGNTVTGRLLAAKERRGRARQS